MELAINTSGRKKLVITKVLEKRSVKGQKGEFDVLDFLAKIEGEDTGTKYQVSYSALFEFIKADTTIDCDVVVTEQKAEDPDGNKYRNRKITQIYKDGKPVKEAQQGKSWGKSPETVAMEIDGKFRDTALMQACDVFLSPKLVTIAVVDILPLADKFYAWLKGESKPAVKAPEKPVVKGTVQPAQQEAALPTTTPTNPILAEVEGLLTAVNWKPVTWRSWIKAQFKVDSTGELAVVLARLDANQTNMFTNHLKIMAEASGVK